MRSLYVRMSIVFCSVIVISSVLGFLVSNLYYQAKIKPQNDAKLTKMAIGLQQFIQDHPDAVEEYLLSTASLGYKMYLSNDNGDEQFYGQPFRKNDLQEGALQKVLAGGFTTESVISPAQRLSPASSIISSAIRLVYLFRSPDRLMHCSCVRMPRCSLGSCGSFLPC